MFCEGKRGTATSDLGYHQRRCCFNGEEKNGWILTRQMRLRKAFVKLLTSNNFVVQFGSLFPGWSEILQCKLPKVPNFDLMLDSFSTTVMFVSFKN